MAPKLRTESLTCVVKRPFIYQLGNTLITSSFPAFSHSNVTPVEKDNTPMVVVISNVS